MSLYKKFSIIIPASKDEKDFSLLSKLKDRFSGHEIILALDSENQLTLDELHKINLNINKLVKVEHSSRAKSLNAGANKAENDYLWFLHIDSQIDKIQKEDLQKLQKKQLGYFKLAFDNKKNNINAAGANFRSKNFDLPFGDQSFLINKNLFNLIGKFDENLKEGEDHKFIWEAKSLGVEVKEITREIITSSRKYDEHSFLQTIKTVFKTFTQAKKFKKKEIENIFCFFMKDPRSKDSKTRLRDTLKDHELVDQFNLHCLQIVKANILELAKNDENKIVIINNSTSNDYLYELGLSKFSILNIYFDEVNKSMQEVYNLCASFGKKIILSGSDIPELNVHHFKDSINYLNKFDSFIIPTNDGGYCCFSTKLKNLENTFVRNDYNSNEAMNNLIKYMYNIKKNDEALIDVDTLSDLQSMYEELKSKNKLTKEQSDLIQFIDKRKYA
jgi:2-phospho-L-lactate guanylyltransferase (CobY/MobA/RfbA family)